MPLPHAIRQQLEQLKTDDRRMPPTFLYNEGWMLRLILDAKDRGLLPGVFAANTTWFSEAQLRTPFGKDKGPKHESNTRADAIIGDFTACIATKTGVTLASDAQTFVVLEAKLGSSLSSNTRNAPGFDQAARNVACIARTLELAGRHPDQMETLGFYVVAPQISIDAGLFAGPMSPDSIGLRVKERIEQFTGNPRDSLHAWYKNWFCPLLDKMLKDNTLCCLSWEGLIAQISEQDADAGREIETFYEQCKHFSSLSAGPIGDTDRPVRGMEYTLLAGPNKGQRVRVCSAGRQNSRVYRDSQRSESFLVPNQNLAAIPVSEQTPPPPPPVVGREYQWLNGTAVPLRIRITNVGDCNSRAVQVDSPDQSFLVPNHQLD